MKAARYLVELGIQPSVQRIAVMDYLLTHKTHPTVDEIHQALHKSIPTLSKTTVYNTLKLLSEYGAAIMIDIDEHNKRFDGDTSPHGHFQCSSCNRVIDIPLDNGRELFLSEVDGHTIASVQLLYKGICAGCKAHNDKTKQN